MGDGVDYIIRYSSSEDVSEEEPSRTALRSRRRSPKSSSKSAVLARRNRLKNKIYLQTIESELAAFKSENRSLSKDLRMIRRDNLAMKAQVSYMKGILANSSNIRKLLDSINRGLAAQQTPVKTEGPLLSGTLRRCETPSRGFFDDLDSQQLGAEPCSSEAVAIRLTMMNAGMDAKETPEGS